MPATPSDSANTEVSRLVVEPQTLQISPSEFEGILLDFASNIHRSILNDLRDLQKRGHLPSNREFCMTDSFGICLEGVMSGKEIAALTDEQRSKIHAEEQRQAIGPYARTGDQVLADNARGHCETDVHLLRVLLGNMSKRPSVCHYAFHRAEKATRSILYLAQDLDAWKSYRRAELVVRRELKKFVEDMATVRQLLTKLQAGSLWDEDDLKITFPSVVARLVGCSPRTFGQANVLQRIAAKSREILGNTLEIRNYHIAASEDDPMRDVWLASLARQAESLQVKLNNIEAELRGAMGAYLPTPEKN